MHRDIDLAAELVGDVVRRLRNAPRESGVTAIGEFELARILRDLAVVEASLRGCAVEVRTLTGLILAGGGGDAA